VVGDRAVVDDRAVLPRRDREGALDPRDVAWQYCGILRDAEGLARALDLLCGDESNIATVATLIARCALARRESRGGHYRTDYRAKDPQFAKHSVLKKGSDVEFR
jgi:L-aspartate oxidase